MGGSNMAPFLTKLFEIVSVSSTNRCINWTANGDSFVISDPDSFARDILPTYFKHNNIRSFIRQLNTYGFRKRTNIASGDEQLEFFHEKFRRGQAQMLLQIKRCHQPKPQSRLPERPSPGVAPLSAMHKELEPEALKAAPDMETIRSRVGELKSRLGSLQVQSELTAVVHLLYLYCIYLYAQYTACRLAHAPPCSHAALLDASRHT
eukprot:6173679-Pleurochrysis_carterae.AAC.3